MRAYYRGYTHFHSFPPSLSALCNPILSRTGAPPPRRLTFPLIHNKVPLGENNSTTVYSHYEASTDLIQVIKVAAVNELTDLGTPPILLLILLTGMATLVDCAAGKRKGEYSVLCLPRLDSLCVTQVHTSRISLSVLSLWALGTAALL